MGLLLKKSSDNKCIFCGSTGPFSGEHKIKRSMLRKLFPDQTWITSDVNFQMRPKLAQSSKSKHFHFDVKVCQKCNSNRFQFADRSFDKAHNLFLRSLVLEGDPAFAFQSEALAENTKLHVGLFQYFARLMTCHISQSNGPIFQTLAAYAIGSFLQNRIHLSVRCHPGAIANDDRSSFSCEIVAAHGGLVVNSAKRNYLPLAFHSHFVVAPIQYSFWFNTHWAERMELRLFHHRFLKLCQKWESERFRLINNEQSRADYRL